MRDAQISNAIEFCYGSKGLGEEFYAKQVD